MKALALAIAVLAGQPAVSAIGERIFAPVGGISIEKPDGWELVPPDEALLNVKSFDFEDPAVQRTLAAPLITLKREPEEIGGFLPTIKVNFVAYPAVAQRGAIGVTEDIIEMLRGAYADLTVLRAPRAETIAGRPAASAVVAFSIRRNNAVLHGESEMIVIPRGNLGIYTVGLGYPAGKAARDQAAFDTVRASIRIDAK